MMSVDYSSNIDEVIELMTDIVRKQPRVLINPAPYTILTNFGADGIELTSYFWVPDPEKGTATLRSISAGPCSAIQQAQDQHSVPAA